MAYPTVSFSIFFVLVLILANWSRTSVPRTHLWIGSGLVFYGFVNPWLSLFLLVYAFITAKVGLSLSTTKSRKLLLSYCSGSVGLLLGAKYLNWGVGFLNMSPIWPSWAVPAALSFITFQSLWSVLQSYRDEVIEVPLLDRMAHICFFPSLSSGPIVSLAQWKDSSIENMELMGWSRIVLGLFQKLVLASIAHELVNYAYTDPVLMTREAMWQGVLAYSFEIYFDFAGYSNMAVGVAMLLGVRLPENFNYPYLASSLQDFWRRWHISLSTFFRDNIYIALFGGNRNGKWKQARNAMLIMLICGLWHGANNTYVIWGLLHGSALAFLVMVGTRNISSVWNIVLTFMYVTYTWIWFRADDVSQALQIQKTLFVSTGDTLALPWGWLFLVGCTIWTLGEVSANKLLLNVLSRKRHWLSSALLISVALIIVLLLSPRGMPSFIYYQF